MVPKIFKNAILEVGTEEIPSSYIEPALKQIESFAIKIFKTSRLKYEGLKTYATPRRLVLLIENLTEKSEDKFVEIIGPSLKVAKDEQGNYTKMAIGFALKNSTTPDNLVVKITKKREYIFFVEKIKGEKTEKLLPKIFSEIIKNISFPKTMIWEKSGFKFARPIRNIVALYGEKIIKFKIADVISSNWTIGNHTYDSTKIKIDSPENYLTKMKNKSVTVDQNFRYKEIKNTIKAVVKNIGTVIDDEKLVREINYLVEYPSAILCRFDKKYLNLPSELLVTCIKKSQKCFAVNGKNNMLLNYFIGIRNGISQYQEVIKNGYEKVVTARLTDAELFYHNDLKNKIVINVEKLKDIIFHKEIGTIYEKLGRVKKIATFLNEEFNMKVDNVSLEKAIMFSKADLTSEVVFEYPELQGIIGRIYVLKLGEEKDIASSVEQHYWPLSASGKLPSNKIAVLISLADKIDTLVTNFSVGLEPSGSEDPYGLRRIGIGFIRILKENFPNSSIGCIIEKVFEFLPKNVTSNPKSKNVYDRLTSFLGRRIENILKIEMYDPNEIKAVINASMEDKLNILGPMQLLYQNLDALRNARAKLNFTSIMNTFKRISNIVNQAKNKGIDISKPVDCDLLVNEFEKALYIAAKNAELEIKSYTLKNKYKKNFDKILELKPLIDKFFEKVMIMAGDEALKLNRISLINFIKNLLFNFMDFSRILH
jgi:glycyl-tRNA synthetase beta chain